MTNEGTAIDTSNLTWRDKLQIIDVTARIAASMLLAGAVFCQLVVVVIGR